MKYIMFKKQTLHEFSQVIGLALAMAANGGAYAETTSNSNPPPAGQSSGAYSRTNAPISPRGNLSSLQKVSNSFIKTGTPLANNTSNVPAREFKSASTFGRSPSRTLPDTPKNSRPEISLQERAKAPLFSRAGSEIASHLAEKTQSLETSDSKAVSFSEFINKPSVGTGSESPSFGTSISAIANQVARNPEAPPGLSNVFTLPPTSARGQARTFGR